MDIWCSFRQKRRVEEQVDHEEHHCSKQMEAQLSIATPSFMATGWFTHVGIYIAQTVEPIKQVF